MKNLTVESFEHILDELCNRLTNECRASAPFDKSAKFEARVREAMKDLVTGYSSDVDFDPHPYVFPDIVLGEFGVEVKFTANDTWRSVANSVFESTRSEEVKYVYVVFGKMGGQPTVDWDTYDNCVIHVRTSHVPRFEVQIHPKESLFQKMGITYFDFRRLPIHERMQHIRKYARGRLKKGERLWWLEEKPGEEHTLPIQARLYMTLDQSEKRRFRAEAALLCPQIVKPSRSKHKYDDATLFLLTYHGVLCPQARDLFSAGSVAMRSDPTRGGN
ncbi:restriction endonuclease [Candidatus Sumerlaeota bacterium]|nr:restriction endonuclease [Candidatus Sumerlaeota bacterium]